MKIKLFYLSFISSIIYINAYEKNDLNLLIETGIEKSGNKNNLNIGIGLEYFLSNKIAINVRLKYGQANILSKHKNNSRDLLNLTSLYLISYKSSILSVPLIYKIQNKLFLKKITFNFNIGPALNFNLNDTYHIAKNIEKHENDIYINFGIGMGLSYNINTKNSIHINGEYFGFGGGKTDRKGFIISTRRCTEISQTNIGLKYKLN